MAGRLNAGFTMEGVTLPSVAAELATADRASLSTNARVSSLGSLVST